MAAVVTAIVAGTIRVPDYTGSHDPALRAFADELDAAFSFPNPELRRRGPRSAWHRADEFVSVLRRHNSVVTVPRGGTRRLRGCAERAGVELRWRSELVSRGAPVPFGDLGIPLRDYQDRGARAMFAAVQCVLTLPCGGGKTTTGAAALVASGEPALVICPTREIRGQWVETLRAMGSDHVYELISSKDADRLGGALRPREVAVALPQVFARGAGTALLRAVGAVVFDEVQHSAARSWSSILNRCPAKFRWGLTATADREDGWGFMLPLLFGEVICGATADELVAAGYLHRPVVVPVSVPFEPGDDCYHVALVCSECGTRHEVRPDAGAEDRRCTAPAAGLFGRDRGACGGALREDTDREDGAVLLGRLCYDLAVSGALADYQTRDAVAELARAALDDDRVTLALLPRVAACGAYVEAARCAGVPAEQVHGKSGRRARQDRIAGLTSRLVPLLVATQVADEGLDVPSLDCAIVVFGGRAQWRAKQRVGRTTRPSGKPPVIFDLVMGGHEAAAQWKARQRAYLAEYGDCVASRVPLSVPGALRVAGLSGTTDDREVRGAGAL